MDCYIRNTTMDLIEKIRAIANKIPDQRLQINTEEATKNAFIMPFISCLGYDVFNPLEVVPEFTADVGVKKGEKVDYAIKKDDQIIMLIECKNHDKDLDNEHAGQLYRYFSVSEARFGILTNGIEYRFFTDLEEPNKMDKYPFLTINMLQLHENDLNELKKFEKSSFSLDSILDTASTLKYTGAIKKAFSEEIADPSEEFVRYFVSKVYNGRFTQQIKEQFSSLVKGAINQFISDVLNEKINRLLKTNTQHEFEPKEKQDDDIEPDNGIVTTEEEIEGYHIVKAILASDIDLGRVAIRDTKNYCGILLDDNNRKPICRLHFNSKKKYIGIFYGKHEERTHIESLNDIYNYKEQLILTAKSYDFPTKEEPVSSTQEETQS